MTGNPRARPLLPPNPGLAVALALEQPGQAPWPAAPLRPCRPCLRGGGDRGGLSQGCAWAFSKEWGGQLLRSDSWAGKKEQPGLYLPPPPMFGDKIVPDQ